MQSPTEKRAVRRKLKEQGVCTRCWSTKAAPGRSSCGDCLTHRRSAYSKVKDSGQCIRCGDKSSGPTCAQCNEKHKKATKERAQARRANGLCTCCGVPVRGTVLCPTCREKRRAKARRYRDAVFAAYGGYRCSCPGCDVTTPEFLTIDHVNGGGNRHRKELGVGGSGFYSWLKSNGFPSGYRVLCFNCNSARGHYGVCPHEEQEVARADRR
jgi:hypothetical protein